MLEIPQVKAKLGQKFAVDGWSVTIQQLTPKWSIEVAAPEHRPEPGPLNPGSQLELSFRDAGNVLWTGIVDNGPIRQDDCDDPLPIGKDTSVLLSVTTKVKEVDIPFELKDLPLP